MKKLESIKAEKFNTLEKNMLNAIRGGAAIAGTKKLVTRTTGCGTDIERAWEPDQEPISA